MKKRLHAVSLSVFILFISGTSYSQSIERAARMVSNLKKDVKVESFQLHEKQKTPSVISFKSSALVPEASSESLLANYFQLEKKEELKKTQLIQFVSGHKLQRYQQYYKGIKVEHGIYNVSSKDGNVLSMNGTFFNISSSLQTNPVLSERQALQKALDFVKPKKMVYEQVQEMMAKYPAAATALAKQKEAYTPKGQLVLVQDFYSTDNSLHLAYKFDIYAAEPLFRANMYIDAATGKLLLRDLTIKHVDGSVSTRYAGTRTVQTKKITVGATGGTDAANGTTPYVWSGSSARTPIVNSSFYTLVDETRGNGVMTYDLNGVGGAPISLPGVYNQATSFTDPDNVWNDGSALTNNDHKRGTDLGGPQPGGVGEAENDDIAFDAHWGAEIVYDYWKNNHGRLSYDNLNTSIRSYIHYGAAYDNAFWNGEVMTYGDGSGDDNPALAGFKPLVSLDVCGHEIGHGVCSSTSNLVYEKESGAMNEGFSDIWASCIENYALTHVDATLPYQVWSIGEQIDTRPGHALRRMDDPKAEGNPDTYGGTYWTNPDCSPNLANDECGVHNNSSVLNHWFYELTAGDNASHVNDLGNTFKVKGVGFAHSEQIAFVTETRLSPSATYAEARFVSEQVAIELYGKCSPEHNATVSAWYAVGVGGAFNTACKETVTFAAAYSSVSEETGSLTCGSEKTQTVLLNRTVPSSKALTLTVTVSGTATSPADYELVNNSVIWNANEGGSKAINIKIKGDQIKETNETIVLTFTAPAGVQAALYKHILTINDDDIDPVIGSSPVQLLNENFESGILPAGWVANKGALTTGPNQWVVGNAAAYGDGNNSAFISGAAGAPAYSPNDPADVILQTAQINGSNFSNFTVSFSAAAGGERDLPDEVNPDMNGDGQITADEIAALPTSGPALDYGRLVYSLDGTKFYDVGDAICLAPQKKTVTVSLPSDVNYKKFYLGFRWVNDPLLSYDATPSFVIDNVVLQANPVAVQTIANKPGETIIPSGTTAYIKSDADKKLILSDKNGTTGTTCAKGSIYKSGTGKSSVLSGERTNKIASLYGVSATASHTLTLYYTADELAAWGNNFSNVQLAQTTAATTADITAANTVFVKPVIKNNSSYYTVTATVSGGGKFFLYRQTSGARQAVEFAASDQKNIIYPNPVKDFINIRTTPSKTGKVQLELIDGYGKKLQSKIIDANAATQSAFSVKGLAAGVYFIRVVKGDGTGNKTYSFVVAK